MRPDTQMLYQMWLQFDTLALAKEGELQLAMDRHDRGSSVPASESLVQLAAEIRSVANAAAVAVLKINAYSSACPICVASGMGTKVH